jgi:hypothetical protein
MSDSNKEIQNLTSVPDPKLGAKGRVTKLGTKNTGSHFANTAAPGLSTA